MRLVRTVTLLSWLLWAGAVTFVSAQTAAPTAVSALLDMNTDQPLPDMSKNRQGEFTALTSPRFSAALKARNVVLVTYRDLITREGLQSMRRPVE